jgi:cytoskeletal protein CcmA (bactofilin family)
MRTKRSNQDPCSSIDILYGAKTAVTGDTTFHGGLRVDGQVKGDITAEGEEDGTLVLSEHAEVVGNVTVAHLTVAGKLRGTVYCSQRIELLSTADVSGELHYKKIDIAPGASVTANLVCENKEEADKGAVTKLKAL